MNDAMDGGSDALDVNSIPDELLGQEVGRYMSLLDQALVDARPDALVAGHIVALVTAMNVLKRLPGFNSKMVALQDLLVRLDKLRAGQKKPMMNLVNSVKTPGRPSASRTDHAEEVRAVSVVQALIDRGWDQKDAVKLVANTMAKLGRKGQRGQPITGRVPRGGVGTVDPQ
ncbi:hypothetical protein [Novosphingobium sp. NDB2Meth1]|uniref:hypothetical protein n=1 Tax=Novosphingobium sp. NDB2Meth1 TaxID=1892847 RepID=UPI0011605552|nr:hypothetical protein [Novosphingobium sp. NDB2Meth1]